MDRSSGEARFFEIVCNPVSEGLNRCPQRLLENQFKIELDESFAMTPYVNLKKWLRPHRFKYWCLPSKADAEFKTCMEDVLNVYKLPYAPMSPVVRMDERLYQLLGEIRESCAMHPRDARKINFEYVSNDTCSTFTFVETLGGRQHAYVCEHQIIAG